MCERETIKTNMEYMDKTRQEAKQKKANLAQEENIWPGIPEEGACATLWVLNIFKL